jgi:hypothetical protein
MLEEIFESKESHPFYGIEQTLFLSVKYTIEQAIILW